MCTTRLLQLSSSRSAVCFSLVKRNGEHYDCTSCRCSFLFQSFIPSCNIFKLQMIVVTCFAFFFSPPPSKTCRYWRTRNLCAVTKVLLSPSHLVGSCGVCSTAVFVRPLPVRARIIFRSGSTVGGRGWGEGGGTQWRRCSQGVEYF